MVSIFRHGLHIAYRQITLSLLLALLVSGVYVGLAYWLSSEVDKRQDEVAAWLSDKLGYSVNIESASLRWSGLVPELQFASLKILGRDEKKALLYFERCYVGIDILASIQQSDVVLSDIRLTKVDITVSRNQAGQISVQGFNGASSTPEDQIDWLAFLSLPKHFNLQKVIIDYTDDAHSELSGRYQLNDISAHRDNTQWTLAGHVKLPMTLGDDIIFHAEANIDEHHLQASAWQFEIGINDLRWQRLPDEFVWQNILIKQGRMHATLSVSGLGKSINTIDADVNLVALLASIKQNNQLTVPVESLSGVFKWQRQQQDTWQLSADKLQLVINGDRWPEANFVIDGRQDEWSITGTYARLSDLTAIALLTGCAPEHIVRHQPAGDIDKFTVRYSHANGLMALGFNLQEGALLPWQDLPGITGLAMTLSWYQDSIRVDVDSRQISLHSQAWLPDTVFFDAVKGIITLQKQDDTWVVYSPEFRLWNDDLLVSLAGSVKQYADGKRHADLTFNMEDVEVSRWQYYLPSALLPNRFRNWADKAFAAGRIVKGKVVLQGDLAEFPYRKLSEQGLFSVALQVEDVQLHYAPKWPDLFNVSATIALQGDDITIKSKTGQVAGFNFSDVTANIRLVEKAPLLQVQGDIKGTTHNALKFLADSPLAERFGNIVRQVNATGDSDISLNLRMPLTDTGTIDVAGTVGFTNSQLYATSTSFAGANLSMINGDMQFANDGISANSIAAYFLAEPVFINVSSQPGSTALSMTGKLVTEKVNAIWPGSIPAYISGEIDYQADIAIMEKETGNFYADVDVSSDLVGLTVATPKPIAKTKEQAISFHLAAKHVNDDLLYSARLGKLINAIFMNDSKLWRGDIRFGTGQVEMPESGVRVRGKLPTLSLDDWRQWLSAQAAISSDNQWFSTINDIALDISTFSGFNQKLTALSLVAQQHDEGWQVTINSDKIKGSAYFPLNAGNDSALTIDLEEAYFYLPEKDAQASIEKVYTPSSLWPSMEISVGTLKVNDIVLGEFHVKAIRKSASWVLDSAYLSSDLFTASVSAGSWNRSPSGDTSQIKLSVKNNDLAELLANFGYQQTIEANEVSLDINLVWKNHPLAVSAGNITGALSVDIGSGSLKDINPNAAERIFGLLSVIALPRRLSLDFSDLFAKGFVFSSISGSFKINESIALTDDFVLKSAAATINITGPIDIANRQYDQRVKVTPNIASTLPVAGFVFGPAGALAGTAIMLFDKLTDRVMGKEIVNLISYNYYLTGTWDDPKLSIAKPMVSP